MVEGRKRAVSLRLSTSDLRRIKRVTERLGVRDCDLIRYAIKLLLDRLSPLSDPATKGRDLMPLFLEMGPELMSQFELDAHGLDRIINHGATQATRVSATDLHLLAMNAAETAHPGSQRTLASQASPPTPVTPRGTPERRANPTRRYLYDKYLYKADAETEAPSSEG